MLQGQDEKIKVPLIPLSRQHQVLYSCHDAPSSGHQGVDKTLARLWQETYWVDMAEDVDSYCCQCQMPKSESFPTPIRVPMNSIPIGKTWQMIAADILEVPVSRNNNRYLMVVQDYFTKVGRSHSASKPNSCLHHRRAVVDMC